MNSLFAPRSITGRRRSLPAVYLVVALAMGLVALAGSALSALEPPYHSGRVTDQANLLDGAQEQQLETTLARLETDTGAQMAVLTISTLEGDSLEDFALRVVEKWQLGRKDIDDGVLLLVAQAERGIRIEVGYGVEGSLTDAASNRVIDELMVPRFRQGDFAGGISAAVEAIDGTLRGREDAIPPARAASSRGGTGGGEGLLVMIFFLMFFGQLGLQAAVSKGPGGWFLYLILAGFLFIVPRLFVGAGIGLVVFGVWLVAFPLLKILLAANPSLRDSLTRQRGTAGGSRRGGGWWIGPGGGGGGGWSGGGGGFSGGGGSFGGGGASGSW